MSCYSANAVSKDETTATTYSQVIEKFRKHYDGKIFLVENTTTIDDITTDSIVFLRKGLGNELAEETLIDLVSNNKEASTLTKNLFPQHDVVLITDTEIENAFKDGGWRKFHETYPNTQGIFRFSNVGFNKAKTQALVYYSNQSDGLAGVGAVVLFEKIDGKWKFKKETLLWIS